jgi:hypothetical protein
VQAASADRHPVGEHLHCRRSGEPVQVIVRHGQRCGVDAQSKLKKISGVGTQAVYYTGGTGVPQVVAYDGSKVCGTHLFLSDATAVGLTPPASGLQLVADADTPALAAKVAALCTAVFHG